MGSWTDVQGVVSGVALTQGTHGGTTVRRVATMKMSRGGLRGGRSARRSTVTRVERGAAGARRPREGPASCSLGGT